MPNRLREYTDIGTSKENCIERTQIQVLLMMSEDIARNT